MRTTSYDVQFRLLFVTVQILQAIVHYAAQYIQIALSSHSYAIRTVKLCAREKKIEELQTIC